MKDTTTTIDDEIDQESEQALILEEAYILGYLKVKNGCLIEPLKKLNQWHKDKARSYVPEKDEIVPQDSEEDMDTAFIEGYNKAIDKTLKAIEEDS